MAELATAYVSLVVDTKKVPGQIKSAFGQADSHAAEAGRSAGGAMSGALGKALKFGAATAGAAAVAGIGATLTKGFSRLNAIDQAQGKLRALGNSTQEVDAIMKNALASVKGTAFGLGDAAGLAGTMVAAGIKPGQELEKTLRLVADSAAIAGTDLVDMGAIWGKVAATGKLDGETLAQLMERQIGILPELAKRMGTTTGEVSKMVSEGKVSFEDFAAVMTDKVGGGAVEMGQTVEGAFENLKAAAGRVGASALEPLFKALPGGFAGITDAIDQLEPKVTALVQAFSSKAIAEWIPKVKEAFQAVKDTGEFDKLFDTLKGLAAAGANVWPAIQDIAIALSKAGAAIGFSTWRLFLTTLDAVAGALNLVEPVLRVIGDLMSAHPGIVTAAVAAWVGFKTIPALMGRITTAIAPVTTGLTNARTQLRSFSQDMARRQAIAAGFGTSMSNTAAAIGTLRARVPILQNMSTAYQSAARNASSFARTQGAIAGGFTGAKGAIGGLVGALGGPVGLGLTATLGVGMWALSRYQKKQQEAAESAATHKARVDGLTESINAYTGALDENGRMQVTKNLQEDGTLDALRFNQGKGLEVTTEQYVSASTGDSGQIAHVNSQLNKQIIAGMAEHKAAFDAVGLTQEEMSAALRGNTDAVAKWEANTDWKLSAAKDTLSEAGRNAVDLSDKIGEVNGQLTEAEKNAKQMDQAMGGVAARVPKIAESLKDISQGETIEIDTKQIQGAEEMLRGLGFTVKDLGNGQVAVTANTEEALGKLNAIKNDVALLNLMKATPNVGMDTSAFQFKNSAARAELAALDRSQVSPEAGLIIDKLLTGKAVSMNELAVLSGTTANPQVDMAIQKIMEKIGIVDRGLDDAARKRNAVIEIQQVVSSGANFGDRLPDGRVFRGPGIANNFDGSITGYVNGGISQLEAYANGGLKQIDKPMNADIFRPQGDGIVFAEKETGGEAYIPLAAGKRQRSTSILAAVADMFGMSLVPKDGTVSGILGGIAGGAVSKLLKAAGADGLTRFADGGFNAKQLKDLANGSGASQPLKGAPYVWGGVNWGDCSGALSALTRAAAGLAPFGGRWSTGSAASDLPAMGFQQGMWTSGTMGVGFYNGGPGGGHTAGTLPDGTNVEMGGSYGGGMVGGSVGANHSQFTDHWFMPVGPSWTDPGQDPGGFFRGQRGNETPGSGDYSSSGGAGGMGDGEQTISGRFGAAAQAAVSEQVKDVLDVFGINDSPGVLAGWSAIKTPGKDGSGAGVSDPGTNKPAEGEDTGKSKVSNPDDKGTETPADPAAPALTGIDLVKDQFKKGLREAWRSGGEWDASDWIVNKESTWNPAAQNGKYWGLIQAGPEVYQAAGVDPKTVDPTEQAKAYDKYVGDRYELPTKAKTFHEANNWYDQGGEARGIGHMLKNTIKPERVLSPSQTEAFEHGMRRGFGGDSASLEAKLDQLIKVIVAQGPNGTPPARDERDFMDKQRQKNRRLIAAGKGGRG